MNSILNYKYAYLVHEPYEAQLLHEIEGRYKQFDVFILTEQKQNAFWSLNSWSDVQVIEIASINDAVKKLKMLQRNWLPYSFQLHRRTQLIQDGLPKFKIDPLDFWNFNFSDLDHMRKVGVFCLLEQNQLLILRDGSNFFHLGMADIVENKEEPPSRAYLKLLEAFIRLKVSPMKSDKCIELGASPGSWTWVLAKIGCKVLSYDRAELDPTLTRFKNIHHQLQNAFSVLPDNFSEPMDWLLSDVICYPDKLYDYVNLWLQSKKVRNILCTLKFQGDEHYSWINKFAKIPNSRLIHLYNNKHELTWYCKL